MTLQRRKKMKRFILVAVSCVFVLVLTSWYSFARTNNGMNYEHKREKGDEYKNGKKLYKNNCQFCHGIRGNGKGPAAEPLLGHPVDFTDSKFYQEDVVKKIEVTINKGKEMMPAFDMKPDEIEAITFYITSTFKKESQNNN